MLSTWTKCPISFISCIWCLLKTSVCICTDAGRMFRDDVPGGSYVWGQACLGEVEMFNFMLLCSRWGTLMHFWGRTCSGTASSLHWWDSVQCYSAALRKITSMVGCRLSLERSPFGTASPLTAHPDNATMLLAGGLPCESLGGELPRCLVSMTPICMKQQPLEWERPREDFLSKHWLGSCKKGIWREEWQEAPSCHMLPPPICLCPHHSQVPLSASPRLFMA